MELAHFSDRCACQDRGRQRPVVLMVLWQGLIRPPAKTCEKGNACLTCNLFVTDERFLDIHKSELVSLDSLIDQRQETHRHRTGETMSENHVWLTLRRREQQALTSIINTLETDDPRTETAVVAPAVTVRTEADQNPHATRRPGWPA